VPRGVEVQVLSSAPSFLKSIFKTSKKLDFHLNLSNLLIQNLVEIFTYQTIYIKFIKFIDQILTPLETKRQ